MQMRLTDSDIQEIIYERNLPLHFKSDHGIEEASFRVDHRFGSAVFTEQWFEGIHINEGKVILRENILMRLEQTTEPVIEMHFSLSGDSNVRLRGSREKFGFGARRHNISYVPYFDGYIESGKQEEPNHIFEIHLTEDYFKRLVNGGCSALENFASCVEKKEIALLSHHNMFITAQMDAIVKDMMQCRRKGALKRLFIESKVLELFMLQVEQFETTVLKKDARSVKDYDIDKIHHVKYLLEKNIGNPGSLAELAHQAGLNEFKLKKGFKEIFGNTVFGYLHELRMEEARRLLLDHKMSIGEVAEYCGYEHVQHFSTAFKKKFGVTPGKFARA